MCRGGGTLPAGSASGECRGQVTQGDSMYGGINSRENNQSYQLGNTHGGMGVRGRQSTGGRLARRQRRCAQHRARQEFEELRRRSRRFARASQAKLAQDKPTNEELRQYVDCASLSAKRKASLAAAFQSRAMELTAAERKQVAIMQTLDREWARKGHGFIPLEKPDGRSRLIFENWNSLKYWSEEKNGSHSIATVDATRKRYNADVVMGCEHQVNFSMAPEHRQFHDLFGFGEEKVTHEAHNVHNREHRSAYGGTGIAVFGRLSNYASKPKPRPGHPGPPPSKDPTGLGRWCSILLNNQNQRTRLVVAYRPNRKKGDLRPGNVISGAGSVWRQHRRHFRGQGVADDPQDIFDRDLLATLRSWRSEGEELILAADLNQHIYDGDLAKAFLEEDIGLREQFHTLYPEEEAPFSHFSGSDPIIGVFATPGVEVTSGFIHSHRANGTIGDHRLHVFDFTTVSLVGLDMPSVQRSPGRNLQCRHESHKANYQRILIRESARHRMFSKAIALRGARSAMPSAEFQACYNRFDSEMVELMLCAEKRCRKKKTDHLAWSPIIGQWIKQLQLYRWILRYKRGRRTNLTNLRRTCVQHGIPDPFTMTESEAELAELACQKQLGDLASKAPQLRVEHLQSCLDKAKADGDEEKITALIRILRREHDRRRNGRLRWAFGKRKGNPVCEIAVPHEGIGPEARFSTRDEVEGAGMHHIGERYRYAKDSPFNSGRILDDIGLVADGPTVGSILDGTYEFPPEYDAYTKQLCLEAAKISTKTAENKITTFISRQDFQDWWLKANENIQSSKSGNHVGHYIAAADSDYLSSLHAARLNLALECGVPYARWGHGLTCLLEKEFGSIYINKLRAICLFEADFNWVQKLIFAQRMIRSAHDHDIIPPEQCATSGVDCNQGSMLKVLHHDIHRTMHIPYGTVSADLANCYDAVHHSVAALALLAFGVPHMAVALVLTCLQSMCFWLRTAFGISGSPFGGTAANPYFGISQGGGVAPPTFQAVSTLMINSYKEMGHGIQFISPVTGMLFFFAAILYVDDTDLLFRADGPEMSDAEFFAKIQRGLSDWAKIAMATGGSLKPSKCHVSVVSFKFVGGVASIKTRRALPAIDFTVPQRDGPPKTIELIDAATSKKTLGVRSNLKGTWTTQIKHIRSRGLEWASKLNSHRFVTAADGWQSLQTQLRPALTWGLVCISAPPEELDDAMAPVFHKSLPRLGVHRSIRREVRTLPEMYQGLGMFDLNVERLGAKIFFLRRHWRTPKAMGQMLMQAYETFQMDVGLHGNIFTRPFSELSCLASDSWFFDLWRLLDHFNVTLEVDESNDIEFVREGDRSLVECFVALGCFSPDQLAVLNRFRKFFGVHSLGEILCCDGQTVLPDLRTYRRGTSKREYPFEKPMRQDLELWTGALQLITSHTYTLEVPLGPYLVMPPRHDGWFADADRSRLYHVVDDVSYDVYSCSEDERRLRRPVYERVDNVIGEHGGSHLATVEVFDPWFVPLHSIAPVPRPLEPRMSLLDTLRSWPNQSLWKYFRCSGGGEWIRRAIMRGSLQFCHDGSYMRKVAPRLCSAAFVLQCTETGHQARGTIVEESDDADNYRAEALGAVAGMLVIRAATQRSFRYQDIVGHCDNMGIVRHGNAADKVCPEQQVQADLLILLKKLIRELPCAFQYEHVFGHLDEVLRWDQLTPIQRLNVLCDTLAKRALMAAIVNRHFIDNTFPFEDITVHCADKKASGSPTKAIYQWWGYGVARKLFHSKKIVDKSHFDLIHWEGVGPALQQFPKTFRNFVTKHVFRTCGCNEFLSLYTPGLVNICPACGEPHETTAHITVCEEPGRARLYKSSVDSLVSWLEVKNTDPILAQLIEDYLRARNTKTMADVAPLGLPAKYQLLVKYTDLLGWQNFIEGRFLRYMVQLQRDYLQGLETWQTAESWCKGLTDRVLQITHKQWLLRNALVHYRLPDGRTYADRERLVAKIKDLLWTDPSDLEPEDRALLDEDFERLGAADAHDQAYWIAEVESALKYAARSRSRSTTGDPPTVPPRPPLVPTPTRVTPPEDDPNVDNEGSLRYRRRKRT